MTGNLRSAMALETPEEYGTELLRQAAEGNTAAREALFELYGSTVWSYGLRVSGHPALAREIAREAFDAPAEGFADATSALLATASRTAEALAPDFPELPPHLGLAGLQERVRESNAGLPLRQREALAMRALAGLSYDGMAAVLDLNRAGVAQLMARSRLALMGALRDEVLIERATVMPECARALPMMAARIDGQLREQRERDWLDGHLAGCERCSATRRALHEADLSYRAWLPAEPPAALRALVGLAAAPAGGRFERPRPATIPAPRQRRSPSWKRRGASLTVLAGFTTAVAVTGAQLFSSNRVAPDRTTSATAAPPLATPEPYRAEGTDPKGNFTKPSKTPESVLRDQERDMARYERQLERREKRLAAAERLTKADRRRLRAQRREAERRAKEEARRKAAKKRKAKKDVPAALQPVKGIPNTEVGSVEDPDPAPSPTPTPTSSPSSTPAPSPSGSPNGQSGQSKGSPEEPGA